MVNFKLEQFEGPLSLLLKLIEGEELDVTEISLSKVADQYVEYIRRSENISPDEMADFLVVASRLLLIKSKALLPYLYPEEEEEIEELEHMLRMYKEFVDAAKLVEKMIGKKKFMFAREFNRKVLLGSTKLFAPPKTIKQDDLGIIFKEIIERVKPPEKLEEKTLERKITIEEKIIRIQNMLLNRIKTSFNRVLAGAESKTEIIVCFLAVLELMRQREVVLEQDELFGEIFISRKDSGYDKPEAM